MILASAIAIKHCLNETGMVHTLQRHDSLEAALLAPIRDYLAGIYCPADGWKLFNRFQWRTKVPDMIIQKQGKTGFERVIVSVHLENGASRQHFSEMEKLSSRLQKDTVGRMKKILVVDNAAPLDLPADVEVVNLRDLLKIRATEPKLVA